MPTQRRAPLLALWLCALALIPGALRAEEIPLRVALLPVELLAAEPREGVELRAQLGAELQQARAMTLCEAARVDARVAARCGAARGWWDCLAADPDLLALGQELEVDALVAVKLARMGETRVLDLRVADLQSQTVAAEVIELDRAEQAVLPKSLLLNAGRFAMTPDREAPWYASGWAWVAIGAGAVGLSAVAIASALVISPLLGQPGGDWDHRIGLP